MIKEIAAYVGAVEIGAQKFLASVPLLTKQHITTLAKNKLQSSRETYLNALKVNMTNFVLVFELDEDDWLANAVENGAPGWDMKQTHLKGPKVKTSKCVLNPKNKVLTSSGWVKIKDIKAGDLVLTHSGKFREVKELVKTPAGIGTKYVNFKIKSFDTSSSNAFKSAELKCPTISLTDDHLVLTKNGWVMAKDLKNGDFVASPSDLKHLCKWCQSPIPINAPSSDFCLNNSCARKYSHSIGKLCNFTPEHRKLAKSNSMKTMRKMGYFDDPDWGMRDPKVAEKVHKASAKALKSNISSKKWAPEAFFSNKLDENDIKHIQQYQIHVGHHTRKGKKTKTYQYLDFYFPDLSLAIELDGTYWHSLPEAKERDEKKTKWCEDNNVKLIRITSHLVYKDWENIINGIKTLAKNHSGELGIAWVKISQVKHGVVNRPDHVYAWKYDICLDADEHSFCCQTVFIHNSGFKYKVIPMEKTKGYKPGTEKGEEYQAKIEQALKDLPALGVGARKLKIMMGGKVIESQKINSLDPTLGGFYRIREFASKEEYHSGKKKPKWQLMMFRVMSENPNQKDKWIHPGLQPAYLLRETETWIDNNFPKILENAIDQELKKAGF